LQKITSAFAATGLDTGDPKLMFQVLCLQYAQVLFSTDRSRKKFKAARASAVKNLRTSKLANMLIDKICQAGIDEIIAAVFAWVECRIPSAVTSQH
jgi:hypothetical protein